MSLVSAPSAMHIYSPTAQTEQELAFEFLTQNEWSDEAYLVLTEASNHFLELSNKQLTILPMPSLQHQRIAKRFFKQVDHWLTTHQLGEALFAPHPIRLWPGKYREPDIMVWLEAHRSRMMDEGASDVPDLVLEVLSPHNEPHDTETKFYEYAQAGIAEYWIVAPATQRVSVYTLHKRSYQLVAHFGPGDQAHSLVLPGFVVTVSELFTK